MVMAGIHYSWNQGTLGAFDYTFYSHKIATVQLVNRQLAESKNKRKAAITCAQQILTLCFADVSR